MSGIRFQGLRSKGKAGNRKGRKTKDGRLEGKKVRYRRAKGKGKIGSKLNAEGSKKQGAKGKDRCRGSGFRD